MAQKARRNRWTPDTAMTAGITVLQSIIGVYVVTTRRNRTQEQIARAAGTTQAAVSNFETGKGFISTDVAEDILLALGSAHAAELAELYDSLHRFSKTYRRN